MNLTRRSLFLGVSAVALGINAKARAWLHHGSSSSPTPDAWAELKVGAGGAVQTGSIADDGTAIVKCDTFGAYVGVPKTMVGAGGSTVWSLVTTSLSLPSPLNQFNSDLATDGALPNGVFDVAIAPSNSQYLCAAIAGDRYISHNRGGAWTKWTGGTRDTTEYSNGNPGGGGSIQFDPANPNECITASLAQGVWYCTNANSGGGTWTQISTGTIPNPTTYNSIVRYDRSSTSAGHTLTVYIAVPGQGVYKTTTGPAGTWTKIIGSPSNITCMDVGRDGYVYALEAQGNTCWIYTGSSASTANVLGNAGNGMGSIIADPGTNGRVVATCFDGSCTTSVNHGSTWSGVLSCGFNWLTATDIPWLAETSSVTVYVNSVYSMFDPSQSNVLISNMGVGVIYSNPTNTNAAQTFTSISLGIEQLVACTMISPAGSSGGVIVGSMDRPFILSSFGASSFPAHSFPLGVISGTTIGYHLDWDRGLSGTVIGATWQWNSGTGQGVVSRNKGATWAAWATQPTTNFGFFVCCVTTSNWVVFDPTSANSYVTTNSGGAWSGPITGLPTTSWAATSWNTRAVELFCVDEANGKVYGLNGGGGSATLYVLAAPGSGGTWSAAANSLTLGLGGSTWMRAAPGHAGDVWVGSQQSGLFKTTNAGANAWTTPNANLTATYCFCFGATKGGASYPSLYVYGNLSGTKGIYRSNDGGVTYTQLTDATWGGIPLGNVDLVQAMCSDQDTYGHVGIGFIGSGYARGYFS